MLKYWRSAPRTRAVVTRGAVAAVTQRPETRKIIGWNWFVHKRFSLFLFRHLWLIRSPEDGTKLAALLRHFGIGNCRRLRRSGSNVSLTLPRHPQSCEYSSTTQISFYIFANLISCFVCPGIVTAKGDAHLQNVGRSSSEYVHQILFLQYNQQRRRSQQWSETHSSTVGTLYIQVKHFSHSLEISATMNIFGSASR